MKTRTHPILKIYWGLIALTSLGLINQVAADNDEIQPAQSTVTVVTDAASSDDTDTKAQADDQKVKKKNTVILKTLETSELDESGGPREYTWLGIATEEAAEVVTSQLGLDPGVGLTVTFCTSNSPAAKADLKKNDVLVAFEGQPLVHPAQLRKLVRARKEGDSVTLAFYRGGKRQEVTAVLGKTQPGFGLLGDEQSWQGDLHELHRQLTELPVREAIRDQAKALRESLGRLKIDQHKIHEEVRRSLEQARKAYQDAVKRVPQEMPALKSMRRALEDLARSAGLADETANVTVVRKDSATKSIVKSDDSGTIVLVNKPKLRLTAHDQDGQLIYEGVIQTQAQRDKVPRDLWQKVEPLLDKMAPEVEPEAEDEDEAAPAF